jgi:hypothetical protein
MSDYDCPDSCNKCKGYNEYILPSYEGQTLIETSTKCQQCGFEDYWTYGYFESGANGLSNCIKYSFDRDGVYRESDD